MAVFADAARAQGVPPPPTRSALDANGVDTITGAFNASTPELSIGQPGYGSLVYVRRHTSGEGWRDNLTGTINSSGSTYTVTLLGASERFTLSGGAFSPTDGQGSTLTFDSPTNTYTYTTAQGAIALYSKTLTSAQPTEANQGRITTLTSPTGEALTFTYTQLSGTGFLAHRLQSVTNNLGYQLSFQYQTNNPDGTGLNLVKVAAINNAEEYCNPTANGCSLTQTWPSLSFGTDGGAQTVTNSLGRIWKFFISGNRVTAIRRPSSATDNVTIVYSSNRVSSVSNGTGTWTYAFVGSATTITDPSSQQRRITWNGTINRVTSDRDALNRTTTYAYDSFGRMTRITRPEGNYTEFTYDARGNATQVRAVAKSGSGLADVVTTVAYPATCINPRTCNKPSSITNPRGFRTDYTYDPTHGGLLTVTAPAASGSTPVGSGVRPQARYAYTSLSAYYKNSSGVIVAAPSPVVRLTQVSSCATTSSCNGAADETETNTVYGAPGVANNLLPTSITTQSGNAALAATTTQTYDAVGNVLTINGPLSGSADTTRVRYDAARQRIGVIGPDPDGGGALKHRAARIGYNLDGQVNSIERGTVNSQSDGDWAAFAPLEQLTVNYDSVGRRVRSNLVAGGATRAVMQFSYDNENRLDCTVLRMNPSAFSSLPTSACALSAIGADGPDRITKNVYDAADQLNQILSGFGTSAVQPEATTTYSANGLPLTVRDGLGNLTTYEYDGFDRLRKIRFPTAADGLVSSTTDYEQYTYDVASNITQDRRRDGALIGFTYDNLNRRTAMDAPAGAADHTYAYDNFGRMVSAAFSGHTLSFAYDQLSRLTSQTGPLGTTAYEYDLAGRRTQLTWPDAFFVTYDVNLAGEITAIRENGAGVLATYAYDNLGRRTSITRGNGVTTSYGYDLASRLTSLVQNLSGTSSDQTYTFGYNSANQIVSRTASNDAYHFSPLTNGTTNYTRNGLNQYATVSGASFSYDGRGNLTSTGVATYGYDVHNRLISAPGGATLAYDPIGRLAQTSASGATTRFSYDGADLIAEHNASGVLLRRYVHGPGVDEPIVWYEGSGATDRRWLIEDQLGSIVATTDSSGAATAINTYDEYGTPGSNNQGRFQYTGQAWLPEAGVYHYKARAYAPGLGRFLQSDPILHAGGMNLYAYVGNDPINATDPSGLVAIDDIPELTIDGGGFGLGMGFVITVPAPRSRCNRDATCYSPGEFFAILPLISGPSPSRPQEPVVPRPPDEDEIVVTGPPRNDLDKLCFMAGVCGFTPIQGVETEIWTEERIESTYKEENRRSQCRRVENRLRQQEMRQALAENGARNVGAWWTGALAGLGLSVNRVLGAFFGGGSAFVSEWPGQRDYNELRDDALIQRHQIQQQMAQQGCSQ